MALMLDAALDPPVGAVLDHTMSPPRESTIDAAKTHWTTPHVVQIVVFVVALGAAFWGVKSRLDVIDVRLESAAEVARVLAQAQDDRVKEMKDDIAEMKRRLELVQIQYQQLRETVMATQPRR